MRSSAVRYGRVAMGRAAGVQIAPRSASCDVASYHRLFMLGEPPHAGRESVMQRRAKALLSGGYYVHGPGQIASLAEKLLGAEISKREHVFFVLIDHRSLVWLVGSFSSRAKHLCTFRFMDMIPDIELSSRLMDKALYDPSVSGPLNLPEGFLKWRLPGGLFVIHNHPGGGAAFSDEDVIMTKSLSELHSSMPFGVVDSLVLTKGGGHVSLRAEQDRIFSPEPEYETYRANLRAVKFRAPIRM